MAHYAFLNENNIVTEVITGINETELIEGLTPEEWYGNFRNQTCKRTSYNGNYRKNYAGIGFTYDPERDAFIAPKPFSKWVLNEDTCIWEAPIPCPSDNESPLYVDRKYVWNDNQGEWEIINDTTSN